MLILFLVYCWFLLSLNHIINLLYLHFTSPNKDINQANISIVIPCRNEAANIAKCVENILKNIQKNNKISEIILVNDNSEDNTLSIIKEFAHISNLIKVIHIENKPDNWIGKSYACWVGANEAKNEKILFIDADIRLNDLSQINFDDNYALSFIFPHYNNNTFGEQIMVPFKINYWFWFILPMYLMNLNYTWANSIGFFLFVDKKAYFICGGHKAIKDSIIDDISLAKLFVQNGYKIKGYYKPHLASIRMYSSFKEAWNGAIRNYSSIFSHSIIYILGAWITNFFFIFFPFIMILLDFPIGILLTLNSLFFYINFIYMNYQKVSVKNFLLAFIGIFFNFICCINSYILHKLHKGVLWKGRRIIY